MKRIPLIVWLVLGLSLAGLLVFSLYWIDQQNKLAESARQIMEAGDPVIRIQLTQKLLLDNKNLDRRKKAMFLGLIAEAYGRQGDLSKMSGHYQQAIELDPGDHNLYNNVAYEWAKRGIELDKAEQYARKAVDMAREQARQNRPIGADQKTWDRQINNMLGMYLDTYGWALYRKGNYPEAVVQLKEAYRYAPDGEIEYHLGLALHQIKNIDEAVGYLVSSLTKNLERPDSARLDAERVYREKNRSLRGFEELLAKRQDQAKKQEETKELADGSDYVGKPAPDFALPDLAGQPHKLSDQRGRIVVIDFWAAWCQPCVMAMPMIDKAYQQYKDRGVIFYGINLEGRDKIEPVKKFIAEKGYGFTILAGGRMGNGLDKVYGVTGIPTSFVIDQNGVIRFRHIGYRENLDKLLAKELDGLLQPAQPAIQQK
ncbi:MAG: redoxin domain-containing protein [Candidatus Edwardsbacteria bacterium]|nr:redoxin domain-containing protein [Candidatus Edwardsbacteria bacterium]